MSISVLLSFHHLGGGGCSWLFGFRCNRRSSPILGRLPKGGPARRRPMHYSAFSAQAEQLNNYKYRSHSDACLPPQGISCASSPSRNCSGFSWTLSAFAARGAGCGAFAAKLVQLAFPEVRESLAGNRGPRLTESHMRQHNRRALQSGLRWYHDAALWLLAHAEENRSVMLP